MCTFVLYPFLLPFLPLFTHIDRCGWGHVTRLCMGALRRHDQLVIFTERVCPPHPWPGLLFLPDACICPEFRLL